MADRGSVTNRVVKYIQRHIQNGSWEPGQKIPSENQLCRELGVSRVSVRNAIRQFTATGHLQSVHGKGTFLISNDLSMFPAESEGKPQNRETLKMMRDLLEFRSMIEPEICSSAAKSASPELIEKLQELLSVMQASIGSREAFVEADISFHMEICRANGNPVTIGVMTDILKQRTDIAGMQNAAGGYYGGVYYHTLILDQIKKRDAKRARAVMLEHLQRGIYDLAADSGDLEEAPQLPVADEYLL